MLKENGGMKDPPLKESYMSLRSTTIKVKSKIHRLRAETGPGRSRHAQAL